MLEQIKSGFVKGETYYVKLKKGDIIVGDLLFDTYDYSKTALWFDTPNKRIGYIFVLNEIIIYRYVSHEEYLKKRKEKYDCNCLNTILKRLINETFKW